MSQPGWYPDPAGSGGLRRWDGAQWTNDVRSAAGTGAAPRPPGRNGGRGWLLALLVVVVAVVVVAALIWQGGRGPGPGVEDTNSAAPTASGWDETSAPTPDPSSAAPLNCEAASGSGTSAVTMDPLTVGPLSMPSPGADWSGPRSEPRMPLGRDGWGYSQQLPYQRPWASSMTIGILADPGFTSTANSARTMAQCILTSGFYVSIDVAMDDYTEQSVVIDEVAGTQADFIVRFDDPQLETKGSRLRLIVIDSAPERTWFFSAVQVERDDHAAAVDQVAAGLRISR